MRINSRARCLVAGSIATLMVLAAACNGATGGDGGDGNSDGNVTITWWDYYRPDTTGGVMLAELLEEYEDEHPDIVINREFVAYDDLKQSLLQSAGADALPDMAIINNPDHLQFSAMGIAVDLTEKVAEWGELDAYPEGSIASASLDERIYGLPITANTLSLFYNVEMLDAAGIEPPTNWNEYSEAAEALTEGDQYGLAFSAVSNQQSVFQWLPTLWQAGGDLDNLDSPEALSALEYWAEFVHSGSVSREALNWDQSQVAAEFAQGRAAMMVNGPWQLPYLAEEVPDLEYGVVLLPEGREAASALGGENYMIIDGPNQDEAWELLKWLQDPERVQRFVQAEGSLPTRNDIDVFIDDPHVAVFTEQLQIARPRAYGENYAEVADHVAQALQGVLAGSADPEEALSTAADAVEPLLPRGN